MSTREKNVQEKMSRQRKKDMPGKSPAKESRAKESTKSRAKQTKKVTPKNIVAPKVKSYSKGKKVWATFSIIRRAN